MKGIGCARSIVLLLFSLATAFAQMATPTPGVPFSADQVVTHTHIRSDGTTTEYKEVLPIARDSSGRIHEIMGIGMPNPPPEPLFIMIRDVVGGAVYALETPTRTAHRMIIPKSPNAGFGLGLPNRRANDGSTKFPKGKPETKSEDLGIRTFEGIEARGDRFTQTYSAASQGEEKDRVISREMWFAKDLGLVMMITNSDTTTGVESGKLTNLKREEPDAALFVVPVDYQIVDLQGPTPPQ